MKLPAAAPFLLFSCLCGALAHQAQLRADAARPAPGASEERIFLPDPAVLRVALMGYDGMASELFWVRTVLVFADLVDNPDPAGQRWLTVMVSTVIELDPGWRTSYMYGGAMLRSLGEIEASDLVFQEGVEHLPKDPTFPFALAMNAYLYRKEADGPAPDGRPWMEHAVAWMEKAAAVPGAPLWYRRAAAGFYDKRGQRKAALRYLEDEIRVESDPALRAELEAKFREVYHDEVAERLEQLRASHKERTGRDITAPEELGPLPDDPLGGRWILSPTGDIRSSVRDTILMERARRRERRQLFGLWRTDEAAP